MCDMSACMGSDQGLHDVERQRPHQVLQGHLLSPQTLRWLWLPLI